MHEKLLKFEDGNKSHIIEGVASIDLVSILYNNDGTISATITDVGIEDPNNDAMFAITGLRGYTPDGQFIKLPDLITDGEVWCPMIRSNTRKLLSRPGWEGVLLNKGDQNILNEFIIQFLESKKLI